MWKLLHILLKNKTKNIYYTNKHVKPIYTKSLWLNVTTVPPVCQQCNATFILVLELKSFAWVKASTQISIFIWNFQMFLPLTWTKIQPKFVKKWIIWKLLSFAKMCVRRWLWVASTSSPAVNRIFPRRSYDCLLRLSFIQVGAKRFETWHLDVLILESAHCFSLFLLIPKLKELWTN